MNWEFNWELEDPIESLLEESFKSLPEEKVTGIVVAITTTEIQVDLGIKYSGRILLSGLSDGPNVKVGDTIEAYIVRVNDDECNVELSLKPRTQVCAKPQSRIREEPQSQVREICDTVREEVLAQVWDELSQMKPELVSSIVNMVVNTVDHRYLSQIEELKKRISETEKIQQ